ncbi:MAG: FAD-dependent oxidoreductase, partial [Candidatus Thermoplasmatota archaeon]|nr:FAD-dependent oxidoreductase [Candidatus Thermoplasmatota archaeon]
MSVQNDYDLIVAGAGLAGTLAATMAARGGASVLLVDRNEEMNVGKKTNWGWTCGDAVAASHIDFIEESVGIKFSSPELDMPVDGVM